MKNGPHDICARCDLPFIDDDGFCRFCGRPDAVGPCGGDRARCVLCKSGEPASKRGPSRVIFDGRNEAFARDIEKAFGFRRCGDKVKVTLTFRPSLIAVEIGRARVVGWQWPDARISFEPEPVDGGRAVRALTALFVREYLKESAS